MDDIILTRDHEEEIRNLKLLLAKKFEVKDFNNLKYFLGMEVVHSKKDLCLSKKIVIDLLMEIGISGVSPLILLLILTTLGK